MAKGDEITTKFKVDISDLKKGIADANQQIKLANAEFKAATAGMDNWAKSADGIKAKLSQLDSTLSAQKSKLADYNEQLKRQESAYSENGKRIEELKAKLADLASQGVAKTSEEYKKYENALAACEKEQASNQKAVDDLKVSILNQQAAVNKTEADINKYSDSLNKLEQEQKEAADAANKQKSAYDSLKDTISDQQNRLNELKGKYADVVLEQGKNSDAAKELAGEIDKLSGELKDNKFALSDADKAADELDHSLDDLGDSAEESGNGFTVLKGALANLVAEGISMAVNAIKDFAKETIEVGKQFDKSMSNVAALSGATGDELQMLRDTAKEFGSSTQFSASEAADALGFMALAGWDANQSASALGGVLDLAAASGMELGAASDMVTDYMSAFGMQAEQSAYFADLLAYAQANANTSAQGLGEAFKNSAANMNAAGQDIETTVSLLSMMANQGLKGSEAGTALTAVMRDLTAKMTLFNSTEQLAELTTQGYVSATGDLNDVMNKNAIVIGKTIIPVSDMNGNYRDMTDILKDVEAATNGMGDAERAAALSGVFTADSIKGLNLILNAGVGEAEKFEEQLRNSSGSAKKMADVMNDNLAGDLTALNSKLEGVQISLYEKFEPAMRKGVEALSKMLDGVTWLIEKGSQFIDWLNGGSVGAETFKVAVIAITAAVTAFMTVLAAQKAWTAFIGFIGKAKTAFAALSATMAANPIGLVIAAIAALVAAFVYLWNNCEEFREFWLNLWENITEAASKAWEAITKFFSEAWEAIKNIWNGVGDWFKETWGKIKDAFSDVGEWFSDKFTKAKEGVQNAWSGVKDWFANVWTGIKEAFASADSWMGDKFGAAWDAIKLVWDTVKSYFQMVWDNIKLIFSVVKDVLTGDFSGAWEGIKAIWKNVSNWFKERWDAIKKVFEPVTNWFKEKFTAAKTAVTDAWKSISNWFSDKYKAIQNVFQNVKTWFGDKFNSALTAIKEKFKPVTKFFSDTWDAIKKVFSGVGDWFGKTFDAVKTAIKAPLNAVIRAINAVIRGLNKLQINIPDWVPGFGGKTFGFNISQIPELAQGGILKRGQMGLLEGSGAEAVVPLDKNKAWIKAVANEMLDSLQIQQGRNATSNLTNNRDYNFTQNIYAPKQPSRIELYRQTKNLLAYATVTGGD